MTDVIQTTTPEPQRLRPTRAGWGPASREKCCEGASAWGGATRQEKC